ncbi:serA [Symbiodinium sp. KB8]|nr:serA [Symbiodinium sp. KB8]
MAHQHVRSGKWSWPPGNELSGRRLGIVGTGQIGLRVAEIGKEGWRKMVLSIAVLFVSPTSLAMIPSGTTNSPQ